MPEKRSGQKAKIATMNTMSSKTTAICIIPNCGESLVTNQLATTPATISIPLKIQFNMLVSIHLAAQVSWPVKAA
jgi:hypothetical protein